MRDMEEAESYARSILVGDNVYVRPLREDDLTTLEQWWGDPAISVFQHLTIRPQPGGHAADFFRSWSANKDSTSVGFSIARRSDDDLLGHVVLYGADVAARAATMAIVIGPDHVGNGYGTDALRLMVRYGFLEMGLHRIGLEVFSFNARAQATYAKLGFREEGRRREVLFHNGSFHDQVLMSLLEDEWRATQPDR